jgi:hypothetical protein
MELLSVLPKCGLSSYRQQSVDFFRLFPTVTVPTPVTKSFAAVQNLAVVGNPWVFDAFRHCFDEQNDV